MSLSLRDQLLELFRHTFIFRSCLGKVRYPTKEEALGNGFGVDGYKLYAYPCSTCSCWHSTKKLQSQGLQK